MIIPPTPKNLMDTISELLAHGWTFAVEQGEDSGKSPFIRIQARRPGDDDKIVTTWHSRETGGQRYRWRSGFHGADVVPTLAKLRDIINEGNTP